MKHMHNIDLAEESTCRFCKEEKQTPVDVVRQCESLARTRFLILGLHNFRADSYIKKPLSKTIILIKKAKLEDIRWIIIYLKRSWSKPLAKINNKHICMCFLYLFWHYCLNSLYLVIIISNIRFWMLIDIRISLHLLHVSIVGSLDS